MDVDFLDVNADGDEPELLAQLPLLQERSSCSVSRHALGLRDSCSL